MKLATVVKADIVDPRIRSVQQPESDATRLNPEERTPSSIDQHGVSVNGTLGESEAKRSVVVKLSVLDYKWNIVNAVSLWQVQRITLSVIDPHEAADPPIDLPSCCAMRMRVVPQRSGLLMDREAGGPRLPWLDSLMRSAVHASGNMHPVPVHRRHLIQVVLDDQIDIFASTQAQRRSEIRSVHASCRRLFAWKEFPGPFGNGQVKLPAAVNNGPE